MKRDGVAHYKRDTDSIHTTAGGALSAFSREKQFRE